MTRKRAAVRGIQVLQVFDRGTMVVGPIALSDGVVVGDDSSNLIKLDRAHPGTTCWSVPARGFWPRTALGEVVVGTSRSGSVKAYRASDGALLWENRADGFSQYRGRVVGRTSTGVELWDAMSGVVVGTPSLPWPVQALHGTWSERFFVQPDLGGEHVDGKRSRLACIELETGEVAWDRVCEDPFPPPSDFSGPGSWGVASCGASVVVVRHGGWTLLALDLDTGEIRWAVPQQCLLYDVPAIHGRLFVPAASGITVLDLNTGKVVASCHPPQLDPASRPTPAVVYRDRVVVPNESGQLAVYNTCDGQVVDVRAVRHQLWEAVEIDGRLVVATGDGAVLVFDESIWGFD